MASTRKRNDKWQVQVRRRGQTPIARSFNQKRDAEIWARQMELKADRRDLPADPKALESATLSGVVARYEVGGP